MTPKIKLSQANGGFQYNKVLMRNVLGIKHYEIENLYVEYTIDPDNFCYVEFKITRKFNQQYSNQLKKKSSGEWISAIKYFPPELKRQLPTNWLEANETTNFKSNTLDYAKFVIEFKNKSK